MFNKKKKYFNRKLEGVQKTIWDFEFKREKTLMLREEVRKEFDGSQAKLDIISRQISSLPQDKSKWLDEQKQLEDKKVLLERDIERLKDQMKGLDLDVSGSKPTNDFPEGIEGINQQLDALRELQVMVKDFISKI